MSVKTTIVGSIDAEALAFTAGKDLVLDRALAEADCIGSAAHVTMLARLPLRPPLFTAAQRRRVVAELVTVMRLARRGEFAIRPEDQDIHLAVERHLTERLGVLGKRIHTARSRNDQVAVDLRLYARGQLLGALEETADLADALLAFARAHRAVPMVGRTHLQPAMPSSVGLWASAYAEALTDDAALLRAAYAFNDQCPLGSAASYGVPVPIDRALTARLLGFRKPIHNVLYAGSARGKCEAVILDALVQVMLTLSRFAEDLILYAMPEFGYFRLPAALCTGSSIMPQKRNPDVLELVRARAARMLGHAVAAAAVLKGLPGGYNRDLQELKEPFLDAFDTARACLRVLRPLIAGTEVDGAACRRAFTPDVFAADRALELVAEGMSFRDAYRHVRANLGALEGERPDAALRKKTHLGAPAGLDFRLLGAGVRDVRRFARGARRRADAAVAALLGVRYPELDGRA